MKRLFAFFVVCALAALLLAACGDQPAETSSGSSQPATPAETAPAATEPADSGVTMTDSYRAGRQAYYDITGIWMPEAEGFEAEHDANAELGSICFDSQGDRALYEAARAVLVKELGEPTTEEDISVVWKINGDDGSTKYYEVYYLDTEAEGQWVFMNYYTQAGED